MFTLAPIRFSPRIVVAVLVVSVVALALLAALWEVLRVAPEAVFPLLLTVLVGGSFVAAWLAKRR